MTTIKKIEFNDILIEAAASNMVPPMPDTSIIGRTLGEISMQELMGLFARTPPPVAVPPIDIPDKIELESDEGE